MGIISIEICDVLITDCEELVPPESHPESHGVDGLSFSLAGDKNCPERGLQNSCPGTFREKRLWQTLQPSNPNVAMLRFNRQGGCTKAHLVHEEAQFWLCP